MKRIWLYAALVLVVGLSAFFVWRPRDLGAQDEKLAERFEQRSDGTFYQNRSGRKDAEADISRGRPKYKEYGYHAGQTLEWPSILKARFGVQAEPLAGCVVSESLIAYADAYNATIEAFIANQHGPDAFRAAREEGRAGSR